MQCMHMVTGWTGPDDSVCAIFARTWEQLSKGLGSRSWRKPCRLRLYSALPWVLRAQHGHPLARGHLASCLRLVL